MDTFKQVYVCNKQNVRNLYHFDTIVGDIDDPENHKKFGVMDNLSQLNCKFGSYKIYNKYDLI